MGVAGTQHRLLIVDDTETFRQALEAEANACGKFASVAAATDGQQALDFIRAAAANDPARIPTIIITDLYMPNLNGVELMNSLKRMPSGAGILGVMVSDCESRAERAVSKEAGCRAFFLKPHNATGMRGLLEAVLWLAASPVPLAKAS
jgi:two-component system chemotaxis response regulator CheY